MQTYLTAPQEIIEYNQKHSLPQQCRRVDGKER